MIAAAYFTDPVIPSWLILLLLAAGALGIRATLGRCGLPTAARRQLLALRGATIMLLALLLLQPAARDTEERITPPILPVLIDTSASMRDAPGEDADIRIANLGRVLDSKGFRRLADKYDIRWFSFGTELEEAEDARRTELVFNAPRTHLMQSLNALQRRFRGRNLAAVLLLTDGLDHSLAEMTPEVATVPLFIPELEPPLDLTTVDDARIDTFIAAIEHPEILIVNWSAEANVTIRRSGGPKRVVPVHLYHGERRLRTAYANFEAGDAARQVTFALEPREVGRQIYRVRIEAPDDPRPDNDERRFVIDVTDPENRILYIEGVPRWEFKFVKRALLKEKNYHLSAFVRGANGLFLNFSQAESNTGVEALPELTSQELVKYRAIILGDLGPDSFTPPQRQAVADFVEKGGSLLLLGGKKALGSDGWPSATELAPLLPFANSDASRMAEGRFSVTPSELGRSHAILSGLGFEGEFPVVLSLWSPVTTRTDAVPVIVAADESPLLLVRRFGKGKLAVVLSDSLWRWQLGVAALADDKSLYERFLSQIVHWLTPEEKGVDEETQLQVFTASAEAEVRDTVVIGAVVSRTSLASEKTAVTCTITTPDGRQLQPEMKLARIGNEVGLSQPVPGWRSQFEPHLPGEYQIVVKETSSGQSATTQLVVHQPHMEHTGELMDRKYLTALAAATGGKLMALDALDDGLDSVPYAPTRSRVTEERPLWNRGLIFLLLTALLTCEWLYRGRLDLV